MAQHAFRLAIVDDHWLVRTGFTAAMDRWPHGTVVLQAEDGLDYERACAEAGHIHIAVVDLMMPRRNGYETIRWITRNHPRTLCLAITGSPTVVAAQRVVLAGGRGLISKRDPNELLAALEHIRLSGFHYNTWISKALRREWEDEHLHSVDALWDSLTTRQKEVVLSYTDPAVPDLTAVATRTGMSYDTAETHRRNACRKLGVHTKAALIHLVRNNGWK